MFNKEGSLLKAGPDSQDSEKKTRAAVRLKLHSRDSQLLFLWSGYPCAPVEIMLLIRLKAHMVHFPGPGSSTVPPNGKRRELYLNSLSPA